MTEARPDERRAPFESCPKGRGAAMVVMQWNEKMSVGVPEIDGDHRQLIRVINQLGANYDDDTRRDSLRQSLIALRRYAEFHFAREEKVMTACGYPGLDAHRQEHRNFVARIQELNKLFDEGPERSAEVVNDALLIFLKDWLNHHILIEDKAYQPFVQNNREARETAKSFKAAEIWWTS